MSIHVNTRRLRRASPLAVAISMALSPAVMAQDIDEENIEEVTVTGSRIPRAGFDTLQPAIVVDGEFLDDRGFTDVGSALFEIPAFGAAGNNLQNGSNEQSAQSVGQVFVDFFGLGSQRTLTLVNGRRFVSSNTPALSSTALVTTTSGLQVDMNNIPVSLIDRIETIAVGGAPIYGADAIAGTVNIIMKQDFEGFEIRSNYGVSDEDLLEETTASFAWGVNSGDGRGNIVLSLEVSDRAGAIGSDAPHLDRGWQFRDTGDPDFTNTLIEKGTANIVSNDGVIGPTGVGMLPNLGSGSFADGNWYQFAPDGSIRAYDVGTAVANAVWSIGGDGLFLPDVTSLRTPTRRSLATMLAHYEVAPAVEAFAEVWVSEIDARELVRQPAYQSGFFPDEESALNFPIDYPLLTPEAQATLAGLSIDDDGNPLTAPVPITSFDLHRSSIDLNLIGDQTVANNSLLRVVGGLRGDFAVGNRDYGWEVSYNRGRSTGQVRSAELDNTRFFYALDVIEDPNNPGEFGCRVALDPSSRPADPGAPFGANLPATDVFTGCAPLDLFGSGRPSEDAINYIGVTDLSRSILEQEVISANLNGDMFDLPAGPIGFAVGFESRTEKGSFDSSGFSQIEAGRESAVQPISGEYTSNEIYAEFYAPLVSPDMDIPFVEALSIEGAWRNLDNELAGTDQAWTIGGRWMPVEDVEIRGNVTQSVRAPSIQELFLPQTGVSSFAADPCDFNEVDGGPNPAIRRANCIAGGGGLPAIPDPDNFIAEVGNASKQGLNGGNLNLNNEVADAFTIGVILRPRWVDGLQVSIDYVDFDIEDAIESFSLTQVMRGCYDSPSFPNNLCNQFTRLPNGQLPGSNAFEVGFVNAGQRTFQAYTAEVLYSMDMMGGQIDVGGSVIHTVENKTVVLGSPDEDAGEIGSPDWQANFRFGYSRDNWSALIQPRLIGAGRRSLEDASDRWPNLGKGDTWIWNAAFQYDVSDTLGIQFNINNVTNTLPAPKVVAWGLDNVYGNIGRYYRVGFNFSM